MDTNEEIQQEQTSQSPKEEKRKDMDKLDRMFELIHGLSEKVKGLESENEKLRNRIEESSQELKASKFEVTANGPKSEWHENLLKKNKEAEELNQEVIILKEKGFSGKENLCPFCSSQKELSLLDLNSRSNRWQCRRCGKSWNHKHLGMPYSLEMEKDYDGHLTYNKDKKQYERPTVHA